MVSLSVAVMAHRKREQFVGELIERLGITDDDVVWDRKDDRWDTGRRAMEAGIEHGCDWHIVIQDDALVCRDLPAGLAKALDHVPDWAIVQPYVGTRRPMQGYVMESVRKAEEIDAVWIEMRAMLWGVAIAVPTWTIRTMLPWCDRRPYPNYDKRVGQFYYAKMYWTTWCTHPSLVDHRDDTPSLVGHGEGRVAHTFAGLETSALDIDWSGPAVEMRGTGRQKRIYETMKRANRISTAPAPG